jgi:hypothetical protein
LERQTIAYEYPTKPTGKSGSGEEQSDTVDLFVTLVPHAGIEDDSRDETAVYDANKEPDGEESREILGDAREDTNDAPGEGESW